MLIEVFRLFNENYLLIAHSNLFSIRDGLFTSHSIDSDRNDNCKVSYITILLTALTKLIDGVV